MIPTIFFIRHGETNWNAEGRLQGQTEQPLNARGQAQSLQAGKTLGKLIGAQALPFISSPMVRTRQTMEGVRRALRRNETDYALESLLKELSFGRWESLIWPEVVAKDPDLAEARSRNKWDFVPPGGESYAMLLARVLPWLESLSGPVVAVSHGGVGRVLMHHIAGLDPARAAAAEIHQGKVLLFEAGRYRWVG
jgi:broad specificity phosphatase PhoE